MTMKDEMKWDDIQVFLAIARAGTLAEAGKRLGVNASTAHRRIGAMENNLGSELFVRAPKGYSLTNVGEALVARAEDVEEAVLALRRAATGHDRSPTGPVTITLPASLMPLIAPRLADACDVFPGLRPIIRTGDQILDLGVDADLAFRAGATPPEAAVGRKIATIGWAVFGTSPVSELLPWVLYSPKLGPGKVVDWQSRHAQGDVRFEVSSVGTMQVALGCGTAQGLLPCYVGDSDPALQRRSDPIADAASELWLLIHADLRRSARVRALVDLLLPRLEELRPLLEG